ncbi:MAG: lipid A deacylase LpxR family protein [Gemmatimonadota bacterium]|nr:lipid A deacylase LpxR family protein [Gemmatimonadota bacterium]
MSPLSAQGPAAVRVSADNDAFNFWLPPWARTDREYTSGFSGALDFPGRIGWLRLPGRLEARRSAREGFTTTHRYGVGQAIYTGEVVSNDGGQPSMRPNAGWLYFEVSEQDSSDRMTEEYRLAVGVVGPPALGEKMQQLFHSIAPEYQRPVDWARQLPAEPGFIARYVRTTRLAAFGTGARWSARIDARAGVALGTVLTSLTGGAQARISVPLGSAASAPSGRWPRFEFSAEALAHAVVRDEFVDGTFFRPSERLARSPFHDEARASLALHWSQVTVAYRATRQSVQYRGQPSPASWGTLATEWRPGGRTRQVR